MRRFSLTTIGRFVPPFLTRASGTLPPSTDLPPASPAGPVRLERLHIELAHAAAHPVVLLPPSAQRGVECGHTVRDLAARRSTMD
ncbi:MAG TPA: hypothetical protein VM032_12455 [Vicinamibacterales bacterium]|nr:hypothetical protein [Vicinamibacterales bacterium]